MFFNFLKKRVNLNEIFYIYASSSPKFSKKYKNNSNIVFIFSQFNNYDLFDLIVRISSFSSSFNFYHREISIEFWRWLITSWIRRSQTFRFRFYWFFERSKRFAITLIFWFKNAKFTKFSNKFISESTSSSKLF